MTRISENFVAARYPHLYAKRNGETEAGAPDRSFSGDQRAARGQILPYGPRDPRSFARPVCPQQRTRVKLVPSFIAGNADRLNLCGFTRVLVQIRLPLLLLSWWKLTFSRAVIGTERRSIAVVRRQRDQG
jgi:hypothetical protein